MLLNWLLEWAPFIYTNIYGGINFTHAFIQNVRLGVKVRFCPPSAVLPLPNVVLIHEATALPGSCRLSTFWNIPFFESWENSVFHESMAIVGEYGMVGCSVVVYISLYLS